MRYKGSAFSSSPPIKPGRQGSKRGGKFQISAEYNVQQMDKVGGGASHPSADFRTA